MARPILRLKTHRPENAANCPQCDGWLVYQSHDDSYACAKCDYKGPVTEPDVPRETNEPKYPSFWVKGQLLRVTRSGDNFMLTVLEEDFDHRAPERALIYDNSFETNAFLGWWYSREAHDPRAR